MSGQGCRITNCQLHHVMENSLGLLLIHTAIQVKFTDLYRKDRVHLSDKGNDLLLEHLWQELNTVLGLIGREVVG